MLLSTYNHATQILEGNTVFKLTSEKLTISKYNMVADKNGKSHERLLLSVKTGKEIVQQIRDLHLDTLEDYYFNSCVPITSGSEYYISLTDDGRSKNISLHHYYHVQIEKLIAIINNIAGDKYELKYVAPESHQDCK